jgi:hypothetical protein
MCFRLRSAPSGIRDKLSHRHHLGPTGLPDGRSGQIDACVVRHHRLRRGSSASEPALLRTRSQRDQHHRELQNPPVWCVSAHYLEVPATLSGPAPVGPWVGAAAFRDPPYNVPVRNTGGRGQFRHQDFAFASGEMSHPQFVRFLTVALEQAARVSRPGLSISSAWTESTSAS